MRDAGIIASVLTLIGVALTVWRTGRSSDRNVAPSEVTSLGVRVEAEKTGRDAAEKKNRGLYRYIDDDHDEHRRNGWPIKPLPEDLA